MNIDNEDKNILNKDVIIYVYGKEDDTIERQVRELKSFCNLYKLNLCDVYIDQFGSNRFENKVNLKRLIENNSNINVLIIDFDRLSRDAVILFDIYKQCRNKYMDFYDTRQGIFLSDTYFTLFQDMIEEVDDKGGEAYAKKT